MCLVLCIDVYFSFPWFYRLENISALTADMPSLAWSVFSNITSPSSEVHKIDTLSQGDALLIVCRKSGHPEISAILPNQKGITQEPHLFTCSWFHMGKHGLILLVLHWLQMYLDALTCPDLYTGRITCDLRPYSSFP